MPTSTTLVHHETGVISLDGWQFLYTIAEGEEITYEHAIEVIQIGTDLTKNKRVGALVDIKSTFSITKEAREYFALHANQKQFIAIAVLSNNLASRLIVNFYVRINRPAIPTRLFAEKKDAVEWLRNIVKP